MSFPMSQGLNSNYLIVKTNRGTDTGLTNRFFKFQRRFNIFFKAEGPIYICICIYIYTFNFL